MLWVLLCVCKSRSSLLHEKSLTEQMRTKLVEDPDLNFTQRTPGILVLYRTMHVLLNVKDCMTCALMNGCECELVNFIVADAEGFPDDIVAGSVVELEYLPVAMLLRVIGAQWVLPTEDMPQLQPGI